MRTYPKLKKMIFGKLFKKKEKNTFKFFFVDNQQIEYSQKEQYLNNKNYVELDTDYFISNKFEFYLAAIDIFPYKDKIKYHDYFIDYLNKSIIVSYQETKNIFKVNYNYSGSYRSICYKKQIQLEKCCFHNKLKNESCSICYEEFDECKDIVKLDVCSHIYHKECIKDWLINKNNCPMCRATTDNDFINKLKKNVKFTQL